MRISDVIHNSFINSLTLSVNSLRDDDPAIYTHTHTHVDTESEELSTAAAVGSITGSQGSTHSTAAVTQSVIVYIVQDHKT